MEEQARLGGVTAGPPGADAEPSDPAAAGTQGHTLQPDGQVLGRRQRYDDHFMMWVWKVEMCKRVDKHDRQECPYAHPGEFARRRHPSLYQALPCPEARARKICPRLENCNCSHSTFEFWLHPDRYKTFMCERGEACDRPICFFAHTANELRELPQGLRRTQAASRPPQAAAAPAAAPSSSTGVYASPGISQQGAGPHSGWGYAGSSVAYQQQPGQHRGAATQESQGRGAPAYYLAGRGAGAAAVRPDGGHRGTTVAVVPAGPSVWQNLSSLQTESGEAPNLEELCAAVTRMAMPGQQHGEQPGDLLFLPSPQQQQAGVGGVSPAMHQLAMMGSPQVAPPQMPLPVFPQQQQQQQQPMAQPPQPVLLPGGQVVYVQLPPQQGGGGAAAAGQLAWNSMQPRG